MRIGEFARRAGLSASKIRFYEARGLLPTAARTLSGYRSYDATDLRIVTFIDRCRSLGFSLADIARFMRLPEAERRAKVGLVETLEAKLAELDAHMAEMRRRRRDILAMIEEVKAIRDGSHEAGYGPTPERRAGDASAATGGGPARRPARSGRDAAS